MFPIRTDRSDDGFALAPSSPVPNVNLFLPRHPELPHPLPHVRAGLVHVDDLVAGSHEFDKLDHVVGHLDGLLFRRSLEHELEGCSHIADAGPLVMVREAHTADLGPILDMNLLASLF